MKNISIRQLEGDLANFRAISEETGRFFEGYASIFNHRSKPIVENGKLFYEIIAKGAFDDVLSKNPDVRLNYNHQRDSLIARTKSKTMNLSVDDYGLKFRASVPNTTMGNDLYELVQRGDIFENSFAFVTRKSDYVETLDKEGNTIRTINHVSKLIDCSLVVDGAYSDTTISARQDERGKTITITISDEDPEEDPMEPIDPMLESIDASTGEEIQEDACKTKKKREDEELPVSENSAENDFISTCIKEVMDKGETNDNKQAYAICKSKWDSGKRELEKMKMHIRLLKLNDNSKS